MKIEELNNIFTYHSPKGDQQEKYIKLREKAKELAILVNELCPDSREKSMSITSIQNASMWANAAIAINS